MVMIKLQMIILIKFMAARVEYVAGIGCTRTSPPRPHAFKQYPSHPCYGHDDDHDYIYQFMFLGLRGPLVPPSPQLFMLIIRRGRPLANDHPEGPASCK